jgi:hypothetical protein
LNAGVLPVALHSAFGVDFKEQFIGTVYAVAFETGSVSVLIADLGVGNGICRASSFERNRCGEMHRLRHRPLCCPEDRFLPAECIFHPGLDVPAGASFRQAALGHVRPQRSPSSSSLNIHCRDPRTLATPRRVLFSLS